MIRVDKIYIFFTEHTKTFKSKSFSTIQNVMNVNRFRLFVFVLNHQTPNKAEIDHMVRYPTQSMTIFTRIFCVCMLDYQLNCGIAVTRDM